MPNAPMGASYTTWRDTSTKDLFGDNAGWILSIALLAIYVALVKFASQYPDLELDDPNAEVVELPQMGATAKTGLHYLLPIVVLV